MRFSRRPLAVTIVVGVLSFGACIAVTQWNSIYAFYLLPTRAWELLAGFSVALIQRKAGEKAIGARQASISGWSGLALLGISFVFISQAQSFPGWIAALPVAGTALIIASVGNSEWLPNRRLRTDRSRDLPGWLGHTLEYVFGCRSRANRYGRHFLCANRISDRHALR
jgi:peptidoglycan/LPS O-acetylase OafA/YrhL